MNDITYGVSEELYELDGQKRTAYGIVLYSNSESDKTASIILSVRDISSDKQRVISLVEKCNRLKLCKIHFFDIIEDFLAT